MHHRSVIAVAAVLVVAAASLTACKSSGSSTASTTLTIATDLPLQGASKDTSDSTNKMIQLYLDQVGNKAGSYKIALKTYDNSTAAAGSWDAATCTSNGNAHVADKSEVAVMGTYNSGCAKLIIPTLNQDPSGPMLMVSHGATYVGLTKPWSAGEPDKYYPTGKRNFARVITTDDNQGLAGAKFAKEDLSVKNCYVIDDNQVYGKGVADAFITAAKKQGINILGEEAWDPKQPNYTAFFQTIKAKNPDCLYIGGIFDNNGGQLIKDKVAVLGDNTTVKTIVPDGFTGYPDFQKLPEAQGVYLTFGGLALPSLVAQGGAGANLITAYKAKYGTDPVGNYPVYGVAAVQVILAAIAKSNGTRSSITNEVFSGSGITISKDDSVLGKQFSINPKTGDVDAVDVSVEIMKGNQETFLKGVSVS